MFKSVRGEYGCGKTYSRPLAGDARQKLGFATSEVQISETETPLHRLETVYRRLVERLATAETPQGALRNILDGWFYTLEEDVLAAGHISPSDSKQILARTNELLEQRLAKVTAEAADVQPALRGYREAQAAGERAMADGIAAWLGRATQCGRRCEAGRRGQGEH